MSNLWFLESGIKCVRFWLGNSRVWSQHYLDAQGVWSIVPGTSSWCCAFPGALSACHCAGKPSAHGQANKLHSATMQGLHRVIFSVPTQGSAHRLTDSLALQHLKLLYSQLLLPHTHYTVKYVLAPLGKLNPWCRQHDHLPWNQLKAWWKPGTKISHFVCGPFLWLVSLFVAPLDCLNAWDRVIYNNINK